MRVLSVQWIEITTNILLVKVHSFPLRLEEIIGSCINLSFWKLICRNWVLTVRIKLSNLLIILDYSSYYFINFLRAYIIILILEIKKLIYKLFWLPSLSFDSQDEGVIVLSFRNFFSSLSNILKTFKSKGAFKRL